MYFASQCAFWKFLSFSCLTIYLFGILIHLASYQTQRRDFGCFKPVNYHQFHVPCKRGGCQFQPFTKPNAFASKASVEFLIIYCHLLLPRRGILFWTFHVAIAWEFLELFCKPCRGERKMLLHLLLVKCCPPNSMQRIKLLFSFSWKYLQPPTGPHYTSVDHGNRYLHEDFNYWTLPILPCMG